MRNSSSLPLNTTWLMTSPQLLLTLAAIQKKKCYFFFVLWIAEVGGVNSDGKETFDLRDWKQQALTCFISESLQFRPKFARILLKTSRNDFYGLQEYFSCKFLRFRVIWKVNRRHLGITKNFAFRNLLAPPLEEFWRQSPP